MVLSTAHRKWPEKEIFTCKGKQEIPFLKYELDIHVPVLCIIFGCLMKKSFLLIYIAVAYSHSLCFGDTYTETWSSWRGFYDNDKKTWVYGEWTARFTNCNSRTKNEWEKIIWNPKKNVHKDSRYLMLTQIHSNSIISKWKDIHLKVKSGLATATKHISKLMAGKYY
jgi:hypothetical protein